MLATQGFANLNVVMPDYIIPNNFVPLANGTVTFVPNSSSISYATLPTNGVNSLGPGAVQQANSPKNFADATGTIMPAATVPGAPQSIGAIPGNGQATLTFSAPATDGGATITGYTVTCTPGPVSQTNAASPIVVGGLMNGTLYTCSVRATNSVGQGPASGTVNVTPAAPPDPPTNVNATAGNGSVSVSFTPPANNGGATVTSYTASCIPGGTPTSGMGSPITVGGLAAGVMVSCSVTAQNSAGASVPSGGASATPFGLPGAPQNVTATPGNTSATVSFSPPASNGGSMITNYSVFCSTSTQSVGTSGPMSPLTVGGLTNGVTYSCTVQAVNGAGLSVLSAAALVTPATVPGAPTVTGTLPGNARVLIRYSPPASNGGSAVTGYTVKCTDGGPDVSVNVSTLYGIVTGLANGGGYSCRVSATNSVGTGPDSPSFVVTPNAGATPVIFSVASRRTHGAAGDFDIDIDPTAAISGAPTIEPRNAAGSHRVVVQFGVSVTNATVGLEDANATPFCCVTATFSGFTTHLDLSGFASPKRLKVTFANINGTGAAVEFPMIFLVGDATGSGSVGAADISVTKARGGMVNGNTARFDVNLDGTVSSTDTSAVKARSGTVAP